jgi:hypothetical protein
MDDNFYANRLRERTRQDQELTEKLKQNRRIMWLGKFAFPKVNTWKTRLLFIPKHSHTFRLPPDLSRSVKTEIIELRKWVYSSKRWRAVVWLAYSESQDTLIVRQEPFIYDNHSSV